MAWTWRRESATQFEQLAVRGGERGFEGGDLVAAAALLVGEPQASEDAPHHYRITRLDLGDALEVLVLIADQDAERYPPAGSAGWRSSAPPSR